jgi:hypothetical protein
LAEEPTSEPTAVEASSEFTAESTAEVNEVNSEAEVALFLPAAAPFLSTDFESEFVGWVTTGSVVAENDTNHALLMAGSGLLKPAVDAEFVDVELVGRLRWLQADAALTVSLGDRSATFSPSQSHS